jgi:DNA-binding XRE family transcriptional regulator
MQTLADPKAALSALLREHRGAVSPLSTKLGPFPRRPDRIGKAVTQVELAEAVGVSRVWYTLLETNRDANASPALLLRLSEALMLDDAARIALFAAAIPSIAA